MSPCPACSASPKTLDSDNSREWQRATALAAYADICVCCGETTRAFLSIDWATNARFGQLDNHLNIFPSGQVSTDPIMQAQLARALLKGRRTTRSMSLISGALQGKYEPLFLVARLEGFGKR